MTANATEQKSQEKTGLKSENPDAKKSGNLIMRITETIRFHDWIDHLDQKDRKLDPKKRKKKWTFILCAAFLVYLLSFLVFPEPVLTHEPIRPVSDGTPNLTDDLHRKKSLSFEMPVDSFENALKQEMNENLPEKK